MNGTLSNVWLKRILATINIIYVFVIGIFTVASFLYELEIKENAKLGFGIAFMLANVVFMGLIILTRDSMLTRVIGVLLPPLVFCLVILNIENLALIIPPFIMALVAFFVTRNHVTLKVILGTVYLLIYVLGLISMFVLNFLFGGSNTVETELNAESLSQSSNSAVYEVYKDVIDDINAVNYKTNDDGSLVTDENGNYVDNTVSPDGSMRFYLADIQDNSTGNLVLYVVPNGKDKDFKFFTLKEKGVRFTAYRFGSRGAVPIAIQWTSNDTITFQRRDGSVEESTVNLPEKNYFEFLGIS